MKTFMGYLFLAGAAFCIMVDHWFLTFLGYGYSVFTIIIYITSVIVLERTFTRITKDRRLLSVMSPMDNFLVSDLIGLASNGLFWYIVYLDNHPYYAIFGGVIYVAMAAALHDFRQRINRLIRNER